MSPLPRLLTALAGVLALVSVAADELPPRALARLGDYRFYHGPGVECAVLSPDGRRAASAARYPTYTQVSDQERETYAQTLIVWDTATGERVREMRGPLRTTSCLAFSPDGSRLAAAYRDARGKPGIVVFAVATGKILRQLEDLEDRMGFLQFTSDGKQVCAGAYDGSLIFWDVEGEGLNHAPAPAAPGLWIKAGEHGRRPIVSPGGKYVAWRLWDDSKGVTGRYVRPMPANVLIVTETGKETPILWKVFNEGDLDGFAFSPDERWFMTRGETLAVWETATGKKLFALDAPQTLRFVLSPDGKRAVVTTRTNRVHLWDLEAKKSMFELSPGLVYTNADALESPQAFSADGKLLLLATHATLRLFDTTTGKERLALGNHLAIEPRFSADSRTLFTTNLAARQSWKLPTGSEPMLLADMPRNAWAGYHGKQIVCHSADGRLFVDVVESVRLRETATGRVLRELSNAGPAVSHGTFSSDATHLLLYLCAYRGNNRGPAYAEWYDLYDTRTGARTGEIEPEGAAGYPAFSPGGVFVAWVDKDLVVHLHDGATGKDVRTLRLPQPLPETTCNRASLFFSADNEYLLVTTRSLSTTPFDEENELHTSGEALPVRVFRIADGKEISRFYGNPALESKAAHASVGAWSPDNRLVALSEENSGTIRLVEVASGKVRAELAGHRHAVWQLSFSPDGKVLASGGQDNVAFVWDATGAQTKRRDKPAMELPASWDALSSDDAVRAGDALAALIGTPDRSVPFLQDHLKPVKATDQKRLALLIADLDADTFDTREAASRELATISERAESTLRLALKKEPTLEAKRRLTALLEQLEKSTLSPETLQAIRAVEALEHIGTADARRLLTTLASGVSEARVTRDAKASLLRLDRRY